MGWDAGSGRAAAHAMCVLVHRGWVCRQEPRCVGGAVYIQQRDCPWGGPPAGHGTQDKWFAAAVGCRGVEPRSLSMTGIDTLAHTLCGWKIQTLLQCGQSCRAVMFIAKTPLIWLKYLGVTHTHTHTHTHTVALSPSLSLSLPLSPYYPAFFPHCLLHADHEYGGLGRLLSLKKCVSALGFRFSQH